MIRNYLLSIALFQAFNVFAQPNITSGSFNFQSRTRYLENSDSINPNPVPVGLNVIWNFSSLTAKPGDSVIFSRRTSPSAFAAFFPSANEVMVENSPGRGVVLIERHNFKDQNKYITYGGAFPNSSNIYKYNPPKVMMKFPFVFNTTYIDSAYGYTKYDGYGTLILPSDTFKNVFRTTTMDSISPSNKSFTYTWFNADRKLLMMYVGSGIFENTFYAPLNAAAHNSNIQQQGNWVVYPMPTKGEFHIDNLEQNDKMIIYNAQGKLIQSHFGIANTQTFHLPSSGLYFIQITRNNHTYSQKVICE